MNCQILHPSQSGHNRTLQAGQIEQMARIFLNWRTKDKQRKTSSDEGDV